MVRFLVFLLLATACAATTPRPVTSDASLAHLPHSLRTLYLTRDMVTDAGMAVLLQLPRLHELDLRGTGVSAETQALLEREHGVRLMRPSP